MVFTERKTLRKGDTGAEVREMQLLLNNYGYGLEVDGKFGAKTETALKKFQQTMNLDPDGICGDKTWAALENGYTEQPVIVPSDSVVIPKAEWDKIKAIINKY
jgi:peptidoglycan hydrolase-like protein with peptidoglycan-binding domain